VPLIPDLAAVIIDCRDASSMLAFYQAACGGKIVRGNNDLVWLKVGGVRVLFREVADYQAPTWPSSDIPMQMHLDFFADDLDVTEALVVMLDPAGHPFCIGTRIEIDD
jgi:glyoxalase superfamily protein